jgi:MFS family permease
VRRRCSPRDGRRCSMRTEGRAMDPGGDDSGIEHGLHRRHSGQCRSARAATELPSDGFGRQWVVDSYALFLAALLLVGGSLGDRFGRRRVFCWGVALFGLASIGCGLAGSISHLIIARAVQGVGGALLVPGSLAIISASLMKRGEARPSAPCPPLRPLPQASVRSWAAG